MTTAFARKLDPEGTDMEPAQEIKLLTEVAGLHSDVRHLQGDVTEIKSRFDKVDKQFEKVEERFKGVDARLNEIVGMIASAKLWAYGLYVALAGTLLYVIGHVAKLF